MALSKIERKLLVAARKRIATKQDNFICYALINASVNVSPNADTEMLRLKEYIQKALAPHKTLRLWQEANDVFMGDWWDDRLAWIDWMLDQPEVE